MSPLFLYKDTKVLFHHNREKNSLVGIVGQKKLVGEIEKRTNFTLKFIKKKYNWKTKMLVREKLKHFSNN